MYKILIVNYFDNDIQIKQHIKYINLDQIKDELKKSEYDLIYLNINNITQPIEKIILADYMQLPKALNKLSINNDRMGTYINLQLINKLIINNIKIIEFKNYHEAMTIASLLKQMLKRREKLKKHL